MTLIQTTFQTAKVLTPVMTGRPKMDSVEAAVDAGCRGIWFTTQSITGEELETLLQEIRARHPDLWVGVNFLEYIPSVAMRLCSGFGFDGLWTDWAGVSNATENHKEHADALLQARNDTGWPGLYFGGVAFKYQRHVKQEHLEDVTRVACNYMDIVCTSGPGTGRAADLSKIQTMHKGLVPGASLALASGVDEDNVASYLPYVDAFIVGTSLKNGQGTLDRAKVERLRLLIEGE